MWWFRSFFLLGFLAACVPVFSPYKEGAQNNLKKIRVEMIENRAGQYMWLRLIRFMPPDNPDFSYRLWISLSTSKVPVGFTLEGQAFRYRLTTAVTYKLVDRNRQVVRTKSLKAYGSYNLVEKEFLAVTAAEKATEMGNIKRLVNDLVFDLASFFEKERINATDA